MRSLLFRSLSNAFFHGLHTTSLSTRGLRKSYSQPTRFLPRRSPTKSRASRQRTEGSSPLQSPEWTPSLIYLCHPSPRPRWLLDARPAQYIFSPFTRVFLSVGHDPNDHNLLPGGALL